MRSFAEFRTDVSDAERVDALVANSLDRSATRPTRPGTVFNDDGGLTCTFATSLPDGVPEANWKPAPEGRFRLGIRVYYPDVEAVHAGWVPPAVRITK